MTEETTLMLICIPPDRRQHLLLADFIHEDLSLMFDGFLYIIIISRSI